MDTTDRRILRVLQQDARITMTALAEQISMSVPATAERVHRLEEQQVIRGYHADISAAAAGYEIEVMMLATAHAGAEPLPDDRRQAGGGGCLGLGWPYRVAAAGHLQGYGVL